MNKKRWFGFAGMAFVAFCAVGASARTSTAIDGKPWWVSDYGCFTSENFGVIANSCTSTKTYRISGHVDSNFASTYQNVAVYGRGHSSATTSCTLIGTDAYGSTVSSVYGGTSSSTITLLAVGSVFVPQWGTAYAHCDIVPGGAISTFSYTSQ